MKKAKTLKIFVAIFSIFALMVVGKGVEKAEENQEEFLISNTMLREDYTQTETEELNQILEAQTKLIVTRKAFPASLAVVRKHEETIEKIASEKNFPQDLALGVALLENGGSERAVSIAGATGIFQITKGTAQTLGLKVNESIDERLDPVKNIEAGITYLARNRELFSDPGLAVWAHHAGPQNVSRALKAYSMDKNETLTYTEALQSKQLKQTKENWQKFLQEGLDIHRLLQDQSTKTFTSGLKDQSDLYPYKVIVASHLYEKNKKQKLNDFFADIQDFKDGRLNYSKLLE